MMILSIENDNLNEKIVSFIFDIFFRKVLFQLYLILRYFISVWLEKFSFIVPSNILCAFGFFLICSYHLSLLLWKIYYVECYYFIYLNTWSDFVLALLEHFTLNSSWILLIVCESISILPFIRSFAMGFV